MNEISAYVHWPFCLYKCPYCDFNSHVRSSINYDDWQEAYIKEIDYFRTKIESSRITSIFFGGGTPSLMPPSIAKTIIDHLANICEFDGDIEITLEANPTSVESDKLEQFGEARINRVSLGIQSLRPNQLKFLGRQHNVDESIRAIEIARNNFKRFSFDLIYARPGQTLAEWQQELTEALQLAGDHLSLYQLTIEKGTSFYSMYKKKQFVLPSDELSLEMYKLANNMLREKNLEQYEISNYAKAGEESKHNLAYWEYKNYLGIGPGAHSRLNEKAIMMIHSPEGWLKAVSDKNAGIQQQHNLSTQDMAEESLIMGLRLNKGLDLNRLRKLTKKPVHEIFNQQNLENLEANGFIKITKDNLRITDSGRFVLNKIIEMLI
jgi:putative oxygen-independent coproporphyrinogen III oxidase